MSRGKVTHLGVVHPTQAIREDTVALLEEALASAKRGEIDEVFVIAKTADGFRELASPTQHFAEWVGRLEIQKHGWIQSYIMNKDRE